MVLQLVLNHIDVISLLLNVVISFPSYFCASACNVRWLGVRGDDLQLIPAESMVPLKPKDRQIAKSLTSLEILPVINLSFRAIPCIRSP